MTAMNWCDIYMVYYQLNHVVIRQLIDLKRGRAVADLEFFSRKIAYRSKILLVQIFLDARLAFF